MSDFKAKVHQIRFPLGLRPRPRWGSLQRSPDPVAGIKGAALRQGGEQEGMGKGGEKDGEGGEEEGRREGTEREGMEQGRGKGDRGNGRVGTGHAWDDTGGNGKEEGEGKGGEGLSPKLQFLAPPLLIWTPHFVHPGSAPGIS